MTTLNISEAELASFDGKTVIITGASSGIGLEAGKIFASRGARVVIADLNPPKSPIPNSRYIKTDVTSWESLVELYSAVKEVDVVVANAGICYFERYFVTPEEGGYTEMKEVDYKVLDVNLKGVLNTVRLAIHHMRNRGRGGSIVMISSRADSATKAAVTALMRATKKELISDGISISTVVPSVTETSLVSEKTMELWIRAGNPKQPAEPVGLAVVYCASQGARANGWGVAVHEGKFTEVENAITSSISGALGEDWGNLHKL